MQAETKIALAIAFALASSPGMAQTPVNLEALKGLAPVATMTKTYAGRAALSSNLAMTGAIQTGSLPQTTQLPFHSQQQQALRDAFITDGNLVQLAEGLGTTLGAAYQARAHYVDRNHFTSISPAIANLIAYTNATTGQDSNSGKYFFANLTTDGKTPASAEAAEMLKARGGLSDPFGTSYSRPGGSPGSNAFGNSRPFQTEPVVLPIIGPDYFNAPSDNVVYNRGPTMNLVDSPSYPSGHTTYGYMGSLVLAVLVPQRYQQMIARGAEYGNDRILMGAHYTMDVLGGRTLALYDLAHLLANDPKYVSRPLLSDPASQGAVSPPSNTIADYRAAITSARDELTVVLEAACGKKVDACAQEDTGRFSDPALNAAAYAATQTYGLPVVYPETAGKIEDVGKVAPEAGYLLTVAFPYLSLDQANQILTETEGPGGGFLDDGSGFGVYSRLNLYAAAGRAAAMAPK
ncbi:phosphatase PAP2 family protein [Roseomonas gilardii]|uniref:Phosphatase PAP2 family protein n=1 Tax=Roseomonas gilardii TaxID=257708 RepID=A0ABU3MKB3_9PROT|nr:phosphatase PAP2 family protein [Roseomonas gilardii]MDT8332770.1 phosphatase PAP2 family protein [Roseomonas gilardii]